MTWFILVLLLIIVPIVIKSWNEAQKEINEEDQLIGIGPTLHKFNIAGTQFRNLKKTDYGWLNGYLEADTYNKHDKNAVGVYRGSKMLGYVERRNSKKLKLALKNNQHDTVFGYIGNHPKYYNTGFYLSGITKEDNQLYQELYSLWEQKRTRNYKEGELPILKEKIAEIKAKLPVDLPFIK